MAMGRAAQQLIDDGDPFVSARALLDMVDEHRGECGCAGLRLSAINTELTALWRWQRKSAERFTAGPAEAVADQIRHLIARRDALRAL